MADTLCVALNVPYHFDRIRNRFVDYVFKPSSDGSGISAFDEDCAVATSRTACVHLRKFYPSIAGTPGAYWRFDADTLPAGSSVVATPSTSGDDCHRNIQKLSKKRSWTFLKNAMKKDLFMTDAFMVCGSDDCPRMLEKTDIPPE